MQRYRSLVALCPTHTGMSLRVIPVFMLVPNLSCPINREVQQGSYLLLIYFLRGGLTDACPLYRNCWSYLQVRKLLQGYVLSYLLSIIRFILIFILKSIAVDPGLVQVNVCTESLRVVDVKIQIVSIGTFFLDRNKRAVLTYDA